METAWFFFLFSISLFSRCIAQERSPHGLGYQKPVAMSPSAYEFFHPNEHQDPCTTSHCSPLPLAAHVHEEQSGEQPGSTTQTHVRVMGAGAIATPAFAVLIILCVAMGIYYLAKTRPAKISLTKALAPDV